MKAKLSDARIRELLDMPLWNIEQVAEYLNMTIPSVRNMATRGEIPGLKRINGKLWFVHVGEFIESFKVKNSKSKTKGALCVRRLK